jgi:hypothetical protein
MQLTVQFTKMYVGNNYTVYQYFTEVRPGEYKSVAISMLDVSLVVSIVFMLFTVPYIIWRIVTYMRLKRKQQFADFLENNN